MNNCDGFNHKNLIFVDVKKLIVKHRVLYARLKQTHLTNDLMLFFFCGSFYVVLIRKCNECWILVSLLVSTFKLNSFRGSGSSIVLFTSLLNGDHLLVERICLVELLIPLEWTPFQFASW